MGIKEEMRTAVGGYPPDEIARREREKERQLRLSALDAATRISGGPATATQIVAEAAILAAFLIGDPS